MKLFIVFVKFRIPGLGVVSDQRVRYIDSQWANCIHATYRKSELAGSFEMFGLKDWEISVIRGVVADANVTEPVESAKGEEA